MKNPLKKLSEARHTDRREVLEREAAESIQKAAGQAPPEASSTSWVQPTPESATPSTPDTQAPAGRRLTVQERVAARQSA